MGASTEDGQRIAVKSREIVRSLIGDKIADFNENEQDIIERIVHSTADPEYADLVIISPDFLDKSLESLKKGYDILTDITMVQSGINKKYEGDIKCYISNENVIRLAKETQMTRAAAALEYASQTDFKGILVVGNAPTSLYKAIELYEKDEIDIKAIIGVPVGFVGAADSKEALRNTQIPNLTTKGPKGGTPVAVATINSLIQML